MQPKCCRKMDKEGVVHIYSGILLGHEKEWHMLFAATRTDLEIIVLSEVSETEEDKYHVVSVIHGI